jgi:ABC-type branched-subunit amino acid transport system substrate-binding protein
MLPRFQAVTVLAVAALLAGCGVAGGSSGSSGGSQDTTPVKIGVVTGLTGAYVQLGEAQRRGAELAIKGLNGKAGSHPVSVLVRDDQIKPDLALEQSKTLVQVDKVDFLTGCVSAATTLAINQVAKQAGIPYLGTCQTEKLDRKPDMGPYTFHIAPLPSQDVNAIVSWVVKNLGKSVYFLQPDYAWGHEQYDAEQKAFPAAGATSLGVSWAPLGTTDFTPYIPKIQAAHPDVLMVGAAGNDQVNFLKQATQFGLNKQMKIFQFLEDFGFDQQMGFDVIQGTYGATNFYWTVKDAGTQKFVKDYQAAYGQPPSGYAAYVYNAVMLIAKQVESGKYKPDDFSKALAGSKFDLAEGSMSIRACDHQSLQPTYIVEGLSSAQAASEGGSAQFGFRKVLETVRASESQAPPCSEVGGS